MAHGVENSLQEMHNALQAIADAVTADDAVEYQRAVKHARQIGASDEQIVDAYRYRARRRLTTGQDLPSFTIDPHGNAEPKAGRA